VIVAIELLVTWSVAVTFLVLFIAARPDQEIDRGGEAAP
jgi:hypothetical protein